MSQTAAGQSTPGPAHRHGHHGAGVHTHTHGGHTHSHLAGEFIVPDGPAVPLHVRGVLLPEGEPVEWWIDRGVIGTDPVPGAQTVSTSGWILPGLVDAHAHIGLDAEGPVDVATAESQAVAERDAGVLLVRDAGSPSDTRWMDDRDDLPRVIRAGQHIARPKRYLRNYADEVEPENLVAAVERQIRAGDGWVKLVGDWIDRALGDLAPLWDPQDARAAIERAHELGARVTAHCFGEQSAAELVAAGIDGIEHGTGLTEPVIEQMAQRQVALVPTLVNLENFESIAASGEQKYPTYARHMRALYARRLEVFGSAREAGVPIYAGTDAGGVMPHGLIGDEITRLGAIGGAEFALGAASWRARDWLGRPGLVSGASADLVIYDHDPREDLRVTRHPKAVILRGRVVTLATH